MGMKTEIDAMQQNILRMGALVDTALRKTLTALELQDYELAEQVIQEDVRIDQLQAIVEDHCAQVIATYQPAAADLRQLLVGTKLASSLERTGDHARHLARRARVASDLVFIDALPLIRHMTEIGVAMLRDSLTAYVERDDQAALAIAARDDEIDALNSELSTLLMSIIRSNPDSLENGIQLILVNRFLERLGDHVTNICEWIVFAARAEHVELNT